MTSVLVTFPNQRAIVAEIETEQALVNAKRELIQRMEVKIKAAIDRTNTFFEPTQKLKRTLPRPEDSEVNL